MQETINRAIATIHDVVYDSGLAAFRAQLADGDRDLALTGFAILQDVAQALEIASRDALKELPELKESIREGTTDTLAQARTALDELESAIETLEML